ncbi:hypothetical protein M0812_07741 [Anaeramoeba flamelloides]|uniref:Alpha/beta hydrolase n=1 Tax=Anaeramoeba flamelloides TaxID=1746091 RepID=A0AAV8A3D9_9EUKA|nr:hypothetical protein M0812_07741 [Anaeramoeba flamelloides]
MGNPVSKFAFLPPNENLVPEPKKKRTTRIKTSRNHTIPVLLYSEDPKNLNRTYTVIFSHGNAECVSLLNQVAKKFILATGTNLVLYEYPGYPFTTGKCSEKNCYAAIEATYQYVIKELKVPPSKIIFHSHSLGTGSATNQAVKIGKGAAGLVLMSPLCSAIRVVVNPKVTLPIDIFSNIDKLHKIKMPVLIISGKEDDVVPHKHALELYKKIPEKYRVKPLYLEGAHHNDIELEFGVQYYSRFKQFVNYLNEQFLKKQKEKKRNNKKKNNKNKNENNITTSSFSSTKKNKKNKKNNNRKKRVKREIKKEKEFLENENEKENEKEKVREKKKGKNNNRKKRIEIEIKKEKELVGKKENEKEKLKKKKKGKIEKQRMQKKVKHEINQEKEKKNEIDNQN